MFARILGSKWLVTAAVLVVGVGAVVVAVGTRESAPTARQYCAVMADGIGVFTGNPVTRRGVTIGTVTGVESQRDHAVIRFDVDGQYRLPVDVKAATVAPSIIAVRQVALIGDYHGGPELPAGQCIDRDSTSTPVSLSQSLEAVSQVSRQLISDGGPQQLRSVLAATGTLDRELAGTGPMLYALIRQLAMPGRTPMVGAVGDMARLIDNVSALSTGLASNWGLLRQFVTTTTPLIEPLAIDTVDELTRSVVALPETLNVTARLISHCQHFIWPATDVVVPIARLVGAGMRNFGDLLGIVPPLIRAFDVNFDQQSLGVRITYHPPSTRSPAKNPDLTCANINRIVPGQCHVLDPHTMQVDAISLALLLTGAAR